VVAGIVIGVLVGVGIGVGAYMHAKGKAEQNKLRDAVPKADDEEVEEDGEDEVGAHDGDVALTGSSKKSFKPVQRDEEEGEVEEEEEEKEGETVQNPLVENKVSAVVPKQDHATKNPLHTAPATAAPAAATAPSKAATTTTTTAAAESAPDDFYEDDLDL